MDGFALRYPCRSDVREGSRMTDSGGGGIARVPISGTVESQGVATYSGINCNTYNMDLSSSSGAAYNATLSVPDGCFVSPTGVTVPATGTTQVTVYVPTSSNASVALTVNATGYNANTVSVR